MANPSYYTNPVFLGKSEYRNDGSLVRTRPAEYSRNNGNYEACAKVYANFADSSRQSTCTGNYSFN